MRIIRRYLFQAIVSATGLVMSVLLGLGVFLEFVGQLNDVGVGTYTIPYALLYAILKLPNLAHVMLPMAVLLGALLGLGNLANNSELVTIRAAGVSMIRLAGAVMMTGIVLGAVALVLSQYVGPPLDQYARQLKTQMKYVDSGVATGKSVWIKDGDTFLNISRLSDDFQFGGVYLYELNPGGGLTAMARADSADIDESDRWVLNNFAKTEFSDNGVTSFREDRMHQPNTLNPDLVSLTMIRPSNLSGVALYRYTRYLHRNGLDARRYEGAFWSRISSAVAVVPMCLLALPFVFGRMSRSGTGSRMVVGFIIGLGYFLASRSLADGAQVYDLNAIVVAWLPTLVLALVTAAAMLKSP
jgi:lipopolysaccharide export system permease protein